MQSRRRIVDLAVFGEVPLLAVGWFAWFTFGHGGGRDFAIFRQAGDAVLHGRTPYVAPTLHALAANDRFVYPTPFAYPFVPFALIPERPAAVLFLLCSSAALVAGLLLLGVRDWRCHGAAFLGAPVMGALGVGAIEPFLLLLVAAGWRLRKSIWVGVLFAVAAAAKFFLWPLLVWVLVTRRYRASVASAATLTAIAGVWLLADPRGAEWYPRTLERLNEVQRWKSYSVQTLAVSLGASNAFAAGLVVAACAIGVILVFRTRADERASLAVGVGVALVAVPVLWLHYLALLLVPVALYRPRLAAIWLLPVVLWVTPHPESLGSVWRIAVVLAVVGCSLVMPFFARRSSTVDVSRAQESASLVAHS
jgi:alpha-1,2-mannosyltransferase